MTPGTSSTNVAAVKLNTAEAPELVILPVSGSTSPDSVNDPARSSARALINPDGSASSVPSLANDSEADVADSPTSTLNPPAPKLRFGTITPTSSSAIGPSAAENVNSSPPL